MALMIHSTHSMILFYRHFCVFVCIGSADDGPRVVFMVDLWHPNVAAAERQALDYIFTPGRLEDREEK